MNVVDSSGWLEYFAGTRRARHFEGAIVATSELIVPAVCIYEVFKVVRRQRDMDAAMFAVAEMQLGRVVDVNARLAVEAAQLSLQHDLPMADSLILAVTRQFDAVLWTQDKDFEGIEGVRYFPA